MNTLAALCLAQGVDMEEAAIVELARCWAKIDRIREKQKAKPKHSALPVANPVYRHVKRGTEYTIINQGTLQTEIPLSDGAILLTYQGRDGAVWHRTPEEFGDGRFEAVESQE
jgi:hypothetical protein